MYTILQLIPINSTPFAFLVDDVFKGVFLLFLLFLGKNFALSLPHEK